jgi:hypothetical protein
MKDKVWPENVGEDEPDSDLPKTVGDIDDYGVCYEVVTEAGYHALAVVLDGHNPLVIFDDMSGGDAKDNGRLGAKVIRRLGKLKGFIYS